MTTYDFIVVGGGTAGACLAARLGNALSTMKILLIEAGGPNDEKANRFLYDRYATFITVPGYNWNYMTTPQPSINNNQLFYARGKGLGGSTAINFCCYTIGPKDDFDEWARLVGDESFAWSDARRRFRELESFHTPTQLPVANFSRLAEWHGKNGPVTIEYPERHEYSIAPSMAAFEEAGFELNPDMNSGNPLGMGISPSTAHKGARVTSASAFLEPRPENLDIKTNVSVAKIILAGKKAVGIETITGEKYLATKEIILSAGSLNSPQILLLSGIGPQEELSRHDIPVLHELPGVGRNLTDHCHFFFTVEQKESANERSMLFRDAERVANAREQFAKYGTGPFAYMNHSLPMGFFKNPEILDSAEFRSLPKSVQEHMNKPAVPTWELIGDIPVNFFFPQSDKSKTFFGAGAVLMNPQSRGTVTLASSNPTDAPVCDPNVFSHPFDKLNFLAAARKVMGLFETPAIKKNTIRPAIYPESDSDEDIWAKISEIISSTWHMTGTCKMGMVDDDTAVVDSKFKVRGIHGLRVMDLSVVPLEPNCHTLSWAYLTGWTGAEALIKEYKPSAL